MSGKPFVRALKSLIKKSIEYFHEEIIVFEDDEGTGNMCSKLRQQFLSIIHFYEQWSTTEQ